MSEPIALQCKFAVDYPTGDDSLSLAVCDFVCGELANNYLPVLYDLDSKDRTLCMTVRRTRARLWWTIMPMERCRT